MQHGRVVEQGPAAQVLTHPQQPYTRALLDAAPDAAGISRISGRSKWRREPRSILRRHCEERSDEAIQTYFLALDCFAKPVIGRAFARPVGSQ